MFNKKIILAVSLSAIFISNSANAVIGPIKISLNNEYRTGSPVIGPVATSIKLDKSDIKKTGATTFVDLLEKIPSITFEGGPGNVAAVRIRGSESKHTLLLIDGQKVTIRNTQPNFNMIPVSQINRVEILKGPFSSLYGPGAIGGVINVFTDKDVNSITNSTIDSSYGSNGTKQSSFNTYYKNDNSYLDFTFTDYITDGIDATGDGDLDPSDRQSIGLNIGGDISETTSISLNLIDSKSNVMFDHSYTHTDYEDDVRQIGLGVNQKFSDRLTTRIDIIDQKSLHHGEKYESNTMSIINELGFDNSMLSLGLLNSVDKNLNNKSTPSVIREIKHTDLFGQWQGLIIDNEFSVGARIIDHDKFSSHSTYNFNWAKDLTSNLRVNASYGSATNLPDHYANNANIKAGKTALTPERSKNLEIGLNSSSTFGDIELKIYKSKISDYFSYNGDNYPLDYYFNDGVVDIDGIELSLYNKLLSWELDTTIDYNKTVDRATKKQKGRRPNRSISINLSKTSGKWKRNINLIAKSHTWDGNSETTKLGGYGLLNLSTSYDFNEDLTIYLNRNNALDKDYEMARGYNTHGKTSTLGLTYNF
tara:strand:+ start:235 stop:2004 length:1770 start_codon:yes stop_codon:yes gene_type:complete